MSDVVFGFISCIAFVVIVLFNVGVLTPNWVTVQETVSNSTNSTRSCTYGLFHSLDCPDNETVFDGTIPALNIATSLCLTVVPLLWVLFSCLLCCCKTDKSDCPCVDGCCSSYSLFYAVGGLLGFASLLMVASKFNTEQLGWSFFMTVVATSIILLEIVALVTYCVCSRNTSEKCTLFLVYRRRHQWERF
ncbi:uncharacterized protein LOC125655067 [Ostrea edulis]|uniref:uncharacterized protein LOC125655067 n=1 Tax=Ostrea edulis TaxID=37623 RepID=UPI0024AF5706|nr:uncharacterized protein LOC125655067 [Ostrea edulis]XP_048741177.2 uncharacterized protein LOC125655067 [Ostrea edulis]XP_055999219.1 uncharacterized protein LOC125655067 [Ostrea edulis]